MTQSSASLPTCLLEQSGGSAKTKKTNTRLTTGNYFLALLFILCLTSCGIGKVTASESVNNGVIAWGADNVCQLGDNSWADRGGFTAVAAGNVRYLYARSDWSFSVTVDGLARAWGKAVDNSTINNTPLSAYNTLPVEVKQVAAATGTNASTLILTTNGQLYINYTGIVYLFTDVWQSLGYDINIDIFEDAEIISISATDVSFSVLLADGRVVTFADYFQFNYIDDIESLVVATGVLGRELVSADSSDYYLSFLQDVFTPKAVGSISSATSVVSGSMHTLALLSNGYIMSWGKNNYGQVGDGQAPSNRLKPARVPNISNIISIAAGKNHSGAIREDGKIALWGQNTYGQIGSGANKPGTIYVSTPTLIDNITAVEMLALGAEHSLAKTTSNEVYAWGRNNRGQLGKTSSDKYTYLPEKVAGLENISLLTAGDYHSLATCSQTVVALQAVDPIAAQKIEDGAAADIASIIIRRNGDVSSTLTITALLTTSLLNQAVLNQDFTISVNNGSVSFDNELQGNFTFAAGMSQMTIIFTPISNSNNLNGDKYIYFALTESNGDYTIGYPNNLNCIIYNAAASRIGAVVSWGHNTYGQLGDGGTDADSYYAEKPYPIPGMEKTLAVAAGSAHSMALLSDRTVMSWGDDRKGQLGQGTTYTLPGTPGNYYSVDGSLTPQSDPKLIILDRSGRQILSSVAMISACGENSAAVTLDGNVYVWGNNNNGQLGIGLSQSIETDTRSLPQKPLLSQTPQRSIAGVLKVVVGVNRTMALLSDGSILTWGSIGDNSGQISTVNGIDNIVDIAMGKDHTVALDRNGNVYTWGNNKKGQLGDGTYTDRSLPGLVSTVKAKSIAAGDYHTLIVNESGAVYAWGQADQGQLGTRSGLLTEINAQPQPVLIREGLNSTNADVYLDEVDLVKSQGNRSMALSENRTIYHWGESQRITTDQTAQESQGEFRFRAIPVPEITTAVALATGPKHSLAITGIPNISFKGEIVNSEAIFTVTADNKVSSDLTLEWSIEGGTVVENEDYLAPSSGTVTIKAGSKSAEIRVILLQPDLPGYEATLEMILSTSSSYELLNRKARVLLYNDAPPRIAVEISGESSINKSDITVPAKVMFKRISANRSGALVVNYSLSGDATANVDFKPPLENKITIQDGHESAILEIYPSNSEKPSARVRNLFVTIEEDGNDPALYTIQEDKQTAQISIIDTRPNAAPVVNSIYVDPLSFFERSLVINVDAYDPEGEDLVFIWSDYSDVMITQMSDYDDQIFASFAYSGTFTLEVAISDSQHTIYKTITLTIDDNSASPRTMEVDSFVARFYQRILGRQPDSLFKVWSEMLLEKVISAAELARNFMHSSEFYEMNVSDDKFVLACYQAFFNTSEPDPEGYYTWVDLLKYGAVGSIGCARDEVMYGFLYSAQFSQLCSIYNITRSSGQEYLSYLRRLFLRRLSLIVLSREPLQQEMDYWLQQSYIPGTEFYYGADTVYYFFHHDEFVSRNLLNAPFVRYAYQAYWNIPDDPDGIWTDTLNAGIAQRDECLNALALTEEFALLCATFAISP